MTDEWGADVTVVFLVMSDGCMHDAQVIDVLHPGRPNVPKVLSYANAAFPEPRMVVPH